MYNTETLAANQQKFAHVIQNINRELQERGRLEPDVGHDRIEDCAAEPQNGFVTPSGGGVGDDRMEDVSPTQQRLIGNRLLITDMRAQNFDVIRFATYRTACKLRYIQKKTNLDMVDIWNIIECFRENGLNTLELDTELNTSRIETILNSIYTQLNKRVPVTKQVDITLCVNMLLNWLLSAFDSCGHGRIKVFSVKVALSHLCSGKLIDKLRYVFTQISDSSGLLIRQKFELYLQAVLALPTAVFEGPSFGYSNTVVRQCFNMEKGVNINNFLNVLVSDPGPQCLMWLPILHRMAQVENVFHPVQCDGCHRESFLGFRYRCQRCHNYQLCQDCFWRGRTSSYHSQDHQMKEYLSYKSPAKQIGHSIKKSFRCVPNKPTEDKPPSFPEQPEKTVDLSYIVPATPNAVRNGFHTNSNRSRDPSPDVRSVDSAPVVHRSPGKYSGGMSSILSMTTDDEHRLIARYAARLAADSKNAARSPVEMNFSLDTNKAQRELISQLEAKNREIMHEIQRLRMEQEAHAKSTADAQYNPTLMAELRLLRQRKDELEGRMAQLQDSRKDLVMQLESLMKLLKVGAFENQPTSPRTTPQDSPNSFSASSPPPMPPGMIMGPAPGGGGRLSAPILTPNTPSNESSYSSSLSYSYGRSSVPLMSQDAYYTDTSVNLNSSSYEHQGRLSAPMVSPNDSSSSNNNNINNLNQNNSSSSSHVSAPNSQIGTPSSHHSMTPSSHTSMTPNTPGMTPNNTPGMTPSTPGFTPNTPGMTPNTPALESSTLLGLEGDVQMAFSQPSSAALNTRNLRNDLLSAADNITGAMSSLVKELNSENSASEDEDDNLNGELEIAENYMMQTREDLESWQREVQKRLDAETRFITELRSKQSYSSYSSSNHSEDSDKDRIIQGIFPGTGYGTDDGESFVRTDDESLIRTDDEDAELYDNHPKELPNEMSSSRYSTEEEGYMQSDAESYIRTDDEDAANTESDWEESMKRWINR